MAASSAFYVLFVIVGSENLLSEFLFSELSSRLTLTLLLPFKFRFIWVYLDYEYSVKARLRQLIKCRISTVLQTKIVSYMCDYMSDSSDFVFYLEFRDVAEYIMIAVITR